MNHAMQEVKSGLITHIGYDDATAVMTVRFRSGGQYSYSGVTAKAHQELLAAESIGQHFALHVRDKYPTNKLEPAEPAAPKPSGAETLPEMVERVGG